MKYLIFFLALTLPALFAAQGIVPEHPVMCSDVVAEMEARCTGSANCRACKNCKYCGYCNSGGSCGVCGGGRSSYRTTTRRSTSSSAGNRAYSPTRSSGVYNMPNDPYSKYFLKTLIVTNTFLNMRSGPGTDYRILRRLKENQLLTFLAMQGSWVKVRIRGEETVGFVHMNYIAVITD